MPSSRFAEHHAARTFFALWIGGCAPRIVAIQLPDLPDEVQWVAAALEGDGAFLGTALAPRPGASVELELDRDPGEATQARLVGYSTSQLSAISPDASVWDDSPIERARVSMATLPTPLIVAVGSIEDGTARPESGAEDVPLTARWLPSCSLDPCEFVPFSGHELIALSATEERSPSTAVGLSDTEALVLTDGGDFYRVSMKDVIPMTKVSTSARFSEAFRSGDGTIWLAGPNLSRLGPTGPILEAPIEDVGFDPRISGSGAADQAFELFLTTDRGQLFRFLGEDLEALYASPKICDSPCPCDEGSECTATCACDPDCRVCTEKDRASVAWIEPGHAVASFRSSGLVLDWKNGEVTQIRGLERPRVVAIVPGLGLIGGSDVGDVENGEGFATGGLYRLESGTWVSLEADLSVFAPLRIWGAGPGFVYGGIQGSIAFHAPGVGSCHLPTYTGGTLVGFVELVDGWILVGRRTHAMTGASEVIRLQRKAVTALRCYSE
ncbi:MAG: hypothetical protein HYV07_21680 [Deltaproteobacteria bacterium]|nr:hypothetical protein [Deltaproteobacteria bacterium]